MNNENSRSFLILVIILAILTVLSKNFFFLILDIIFIVIFLFFNGNLRQINFNNYISKFIRKNKSNIDNSVIIEDGYYKIESEVKTILVVDDIPFDYRDMSDESLRTKIIAFHKVLDTLGNVEIVFRKQALDKNKFLEGLFLKAQNLRVIVDADPSNEKARNELELVNAMIKKISEGEPPFRYIIYFVINEKSVEKALASADLLKKGLESIGIKARLASKKEILDLFQDKISFRKTIFPSQLPFLTVFSLPKAPKFEFLSDGIYIGKEIGSRRSVFWNYNQMINPHVLIIGPTGAGKTEFLITLGYKINLFSHIPLVFFDTKSDIKIRLKKYGIKFKIINPIIYSLGLNKIDNIDTESYLFQVEEILANSFKLDKYTSSILYKIIKDVYYRYNKLDWDIIIDEINELDLPLQVKTYLTRLVSLVKDFDYKDTDDIVSLLNKDEIYVVDLSLIKSEEIRRFLMLSILTKIYNKYTVADDKLKIGLVIDEAWTILKDVSEYSIIIDMIKRGRGFGIMLLMATQNIEDLGNQDNVYLQNIGLIAFMNNGDKKFWQEVFRFVNLSNEEIEKELSFLGRGEALVRFITDPRPVIVELDSLAGYSLKN